MGDVDGGTHFMRHEPDTMETGPKVLGHIFILLPTKHSDSGKYPEATVAGSVYSSG